MAVTKITEAYLKACTLPEAGQTLVYDTELTGFGVRLNPKSIVFFIEKRLGGTTKKKRLTIGQYPFYKVAEARREAELRIAELIKGIDKRAIDIANASTQVTLEKLLSQYLSQRTLKFKTAKRYEYCLNVLLDNWFTEPWTEITSTKVKVRHAELTAKNGPGAANYTFRALSAVINFGLGIYRDKDDQPIIKENPVLVLSRTKSWNKLKPRSNYVKETELKRWWTGVENLSNNDAKDFFRLLILTGLRRSEALSIKWNDIDFKARTVTIPTTKNGDKHVLPLTPYLQDLLVQRKTQSSSSYVFHGKGKLGHTVEIKRSLAQARKLSGVSFSCHDLRRSFATYADILEISSNGIKRLLNHKSGNDVTYSHYLPFNVERLRDPMKKINHYILSHAGVNKSSVVQIQEVTAALPLTA